MSWIIAGLKFFSRSVLRVPWQLYAIMGALIALGMLWLFVNHRIEEAERNGYSRAMAAVRIKAMKIEAKAKDMQVAAAELKEGIARDHEAHRADIRVRAERLRGERQAQAAAPRPGPALPAAPGQSDGAAGDDGLPWDRAIDVLEQCELNTRQLIDLQDAARRLGLAQ